MHCPNAPVFDNMTLLEFARQYFMPKEPGSEPSHRSKHIVVIPQPYCSPDPVSPKYEQYCRQSLMQHKSFHLVDDLCTGYATFVDAYAAFLQSGSVPPLLEDDIHRLQEYIHFNSEEHDTTVHVTYPHTCKCTCTCTWKYMCIAH